MFSVFVCVYCDLLLNIAIAEESFSKFNSYHQLIGEFKLNKTSSAQIPANGIS